VLCTTAKAEDYEHNLPDDRVKRHLEVDERRWKTTLGNIGIFWLPMFQECYKNIYANIYLQGLKLQTYTVKFL
jgi:hypothetical protein